MTDNSRTKTPFEEISSSDSDVPAQPQQRRTRSRSPASARNLPVQASSRRSDKPQLERTYTAQQQKRAAQVLQRRKESRPEPIQESPKQVLTPPSPRKKGKMAPSSFKIPIFRGEKGKLEVFIAMCRIAIKRDEDVDDDEDKVILTGSHLEAGPLGWFTPILNDYLEHGDNARPEVRQLFANYDNFLGQLRSMYGGGDPQKDARFKLEKLQQGRSPVTQYVANFEQYAYLTEYNEVALLENFYGGLNEDIKGLLIHEDRPTTLPRMKERVIELDRRLQERRREKLGFKTWTPNTGRPRYQDNRRTEPMDLDALQQRRPVKGKQLKHGKLSKKDREYRLANNLCLYCGKAGHRATECNSSKNRSSPKKIYALTANDEHNMGRDGYNKSQDIEQLAALEAYTIEDNEEDEPRLAALTKDRWEDYEQPGDVDWNDVSQQGTYNEQLSVVMARAEEQELTMQEDNEQEVDESQARGELEEEEQDTSSSEDEPTDEMQTLIRNQTERMSRMPLTRIIVNIVTGEVIFPGWKKVTSATSPTGQWKITFQDLAMEHDENTAYRTRVIRNQGGYWRTVAQFMENGQVVPAARVGIPARPPTPYPHEQDRHSAQYPQFRARATDRS